ncbi:MAG TPA: PRC-barrel domain-containing protein [Azospirillum sp.]|nr:PRC-barrel domain-containing protein [Azospirillum sp.]
MRSRTFLLSFALLSFAAVLALSASALAQQPCAEPLRTLDQRTAALEAGGVPGPALTESERGALRGMRQAAERLQQAGNSEGCLAVVRDAQALIRNIERPQVLPVDDLDKIALQSAQGEKVGEIDEVIVDPNTGRIAYAVVEMGGFLGMGERHVPVPWAAFQPAPDGQGLVLNATRDRLTAAPQFSRDNRPNMSDRQWAVAVHTYYGVPPYWVQGAAAYAAETQGQAMQNADTARLQQEVQRLSQEVQRLNQDLAQARAGQTQPDPASGSSQSAPADDGARTSQGTSQ